MMAAALPFVLFLMPASVWATPCDLKMVGSCPDSEAADAILLMQSRTNVVHEVERTHDNTVLQDKSDAMNNHTHLLGRKTEEHNALKEEHDALKVTYFGSSYFVSANPDLQLKGVFDYIANNNKWNSPESVSGEGSTLKITAPVRECLGQLIQKYNVKEFVDVPCGDANWQAHIPGLEHVKYNGYDIADRPIQRAREKNSERTWMSFGHLDLTNQIPPEKPDIIMLRAVIQHLPLMKGRQMLLNAKRSGARYLAVDSFNDGVNVEIPAGSFFKHDVHASPFNLPSPLEACQNYAWGYPTVFLELIDLSTWNPVD